MGGYIGSKASVVSSGAERKQTYAITTTTTSLTGLAYTPTKVHVYHNGIRLVDGTDYTATDGSSITLTTAAENGDEVVVISYATFQTSDTVSAANGGTFAGNVEHTGTLTASGALNTGSILPSTDNASDLGSTSKRFQDLHLSGGVSFDEDPSLVTGSVTGKTLDDYEEGTFTPSVTSGFTSTTLNNTSSTYTRVGRLVNFQMRLEITAGTQDSTMFKIGGLPYTQENTRQGTCSIGYWNASGVTSRHIAVLVNGNTLQFYEYGGNNLNGTEIADSTWTLHISGDYITT